MRGTRRGDGPIHPPGGGETQEENDGDRTPQDSAPQGRKVCEASWQVAGLPMLVGYLADDFARLIRGPRRFRKPSERRRGVVLS